MKQLIAILLVMVMMIALVACKDNGSNVEPNNTTPSVTEPDNTEPENTDPEETTENSESEVSDTENRLMALFNEVPMEFPVMTWAVDLTDAEAVKAYAGLDSVDKIEEIAITEPAMSSQAYSLVLVKVKDVADVDAIAEEMKNGVNPRKWICVEADDMDVAVYENYVLLAMMSSDFAETITAEGVTEAFNTVMNNYIAATSDIDGAVG